MSEVTLSKCNHWAAAFVLQVHVFSTIDRLMNPEHRERKLELSTTQITGSALAAMSGAFFASWAGTTGTIVGAALGSVIVTVGAATYTWSLQRTRDAVKRTVTAGRLRTTPEPETPRRSLPWGKLALTSVAVMALGLGGITAIEAATGRPVSSYTGSSDSTGTTLGNVVGSTGTTATRQSGTSTAEKSDSSTTGGAETGSTGGSTDGSAGTTTPTTPATPAPSADPTTTPTPDPTVTEPVTPTPDPQPSTQP